MPWASSKQDVISRHEKWKRCLPVGRTAACRLSGEGLRVEALAYCAALGFAAVAAALRRFQAARSLAFVAADIL